MLRKTSGPHPPEDPVPTASSDNPREVAPCVLGAEPAPLLPGALELSKYLIFTTALRGRYLIPEKEDTEAQQSKVCPRLSRSPLLPMFHWFIVSGWYLDDFTWTC
jgi:hypothetical protein